MTPSCYVCNTPSGNYFQQIDDGFSIIKCSYCGLEYTHPIPSNEILAAFYSQYNDVRAEPEIVKLNSKKHLRELSKFGWTPEARLLDFGTGEGVFIETAGNNAFGVDFRPSNNQRIKSSVEEYRDEQFDFITLFGVLEHLSNPVQTLNRLVPMLRDKGLIAVTTVNAEGKIPYFYKPPEHLSYWTRQAFEALCSKCNIEIVKYKPFEMFQLGSIYFERLLSRTPVKYRQSINNKLPKIVSVPTNEVLCLMKLRQDRNINV